MYLPDVVLTASDLFAFACMMSQPQLVGPKVRVLVLLISSPFLYANVMQDPPPKFGLSRMSYPCSSLEIVWVTFSRRSDWDCCCCCCCCSLLWKQTKDFTYALFSFDTFHLPYICLFQVKIYVGIAPGWSARVRFPTGQDFLFSIPPRPNLRPTQPPVQLVRGAISPGVKRRGREADLLSPASAEVKNCGVIPPLPHMSSWRSA
jgi:hypothetical protein